MLLKLVIIRLAPLGALCFMKKKQQMRRGVYLYAIGFVALFITAVAILFERYQWKILLYLPVLVLPQYIFYVFSLWILLRCVRQSWSERVRKRICFLSIYSTAMGVFAEKYCNSIVLQFFFEFFK